MKTSVLLKILTNSNMKQRLLQNKNRFIITIKINEKSTINE